MATWNPWHGCTKISPGCYHCYVYRRDAEFGKDTSVVSKTASFNLPVKKNEKENISSSRTAIMYIPALHLIFFTLQLTNGEKRPGR